MLYRCNFHIFQCKRIQNNRYSLKNNSVTRDITGRIIRKYLIVELN